MRIWFIGFALFMFYLATDGYEEMRLIYGGVRRTKGCVVMMMFISLCEGIRGVG